MIKDEEILYFYILNKKNIKNYKKIVKATNKWNRGFKNGETPDPQLRWNINYLIDDFHNQTEEENKSPVFLGDKYTITTFLNSIYYEYIDKPLFINEKLINNLLKLIEEYEKEKSNIEFLKEININTLRRFLNKNIGRKLYIKSIYDSNDIRLKYKSTVLKDDSYFKFSQIAEYVKKYSAEEFLDIFFNDSIKNIDKNLEKLSFENSIDVIVGDNIPSFTLYWYENWHYSQVTWEILENFIYPVYYDENNDEMYVFDYNENLWKTRFIESENELETYAISNRTDFYDKYNWYPHIETENGFIPLSYTGELLINNRKAYLFYDINNSSEFFEIHNGYDFNNIIDRDECFAVIWEDNLELDKKFVKHKLSKFDYDLIKISDKEDFSPNDNKRFIPYDDLFNFSPLVQDYYGPDMKDLIDNKWKFIYQIPMPWYGARKTEETNLYYIDEGDLGSISIFMNKDNEFKIEYSQT